MKRNVEVFRTKIISLLTSQLDIVKEFSMPDDEERESIDVNKVVESITSAEKENTVEDTLKRLERVTMELPRLILNENGEYVAADSVNTTDDKVAENNNDYDEELGF